VEKSGYEGIPCEQPVSVLRSRVARYLILYVVNVLDISYRGNLTSGELLGAILYVRVSQLGFSSGVF